MAITIKSYLMSNEARGKPEVRRFPVTDAEATTYTFLREKLLSIYGNVLIDSPFVIFWLDEEGDEVVVSSNDELKIALSFIKDGVFKLYIRKVESKASADENGKPDELHTLVTCDSCNGEVRGFRYKCSECDDFDLCSNCEGKGHHAEHVMTRIPSPNSHWGGGGGFAFSFGPRGPRCRNWRRSHRRGHRGGDDCPFKAHEARGGQGAQCGAGAGGQGGEGGGGNGGQGTEGAQQQQGLPPNFAHVINGVLSGIGGFINPEMLSNLIGAQQPNGNNGADTRRDSKTCGEGGSAKACPQTPVNSDEYLKRVGDTIAALLDPMGIDVEVDVERNAGVRERCGAGDTSRMTGGQETTTPSNENTDDRRPADVEMSDHQEPVASQNNETARTGGSCSPVSSDWVDVGKVVDGMEHVTVSSSSVPNEPIDNVEPMSAVPQVQPGPLHHDPLIAAAAKQMMMMGFNNDQGWLTALLELKNGNISDTLDTLTLLNQYTRGNTELIGQIVLSVVNTDIPGDPRHRLAAIETMGKKVAEDRR